MGANNADNRYWNDPSGNIRRMEGEQDVIATVTNECSNEELQAMVDGLECGTDNDRLRRELEEAKAELARMKATCDAPRMCPWCHMIPLVRPDWTDCRRFRVDCTNDDCPVKPSCKGDSEEEAVAIWNGGAIHGKADEQL